MNASPPPDLVLHLYSGRIAMPANWPTRTITLGSQQLNCIHGKDVSLREFEKSLEDLASFLDNRFQCYFEWDGSFVCSGKHEGYVWQLFGMAYDKADCLQRVELKGNCPYAKLRELIDFLRPMRGEVVVHLPVVGEYIQDTELERLWNA